ncbi:hypothetical protein B0H13DRAFT_2101510 [Mycena leptocephala]|nr:hypothetical protein B0H13DRAFT_2101510 [Mycena leptocephala]
MYVVLHWCSQCATDELQHTRLLPLAAPPPARRQRGRADIKPSFTTRRARPDARMEVDCAAPPETPTPLAPAATTSTSKSSTGARIAAPQPAEFLACLQRACGALVATEPEITRMDTIAGDGD